MTIKVFSHNSLASGITALIFGMLLIYFKGELINILLISVGCLLVAYSIYRFIAFLKQTNKIENRWAYLPFSTIFSAIIGILFIISPTFWVSLTEIIIALFVMVLAIGKITLLIQFKMNDIKISNFYFLIPCILLFAGVLAIMYPEYFLGSITAAFGVLIILFGVSEIIDYIIIRNKNLSRKFGSISYAEPDKEYIEAEEIKDEN